MALFFDREAEPEKGIKMNYPSIFNDVIGPVMRGPSSSHCAGALRIGRLARDLMQDGDLTEVLLEFDQFGSLATTHTSQGSDMGFAGGLLGWDTTDPRMADAEKELFRKGISISYVVGQYQMDHPNTYQITLTSSIEKKVIRAVSTGGGMVEIISIDSFPISIEGDFFETLLFTSSADINFDFHSVIGAGDILNILNSKDGFCIQLKTQEPIDEDTITAIGSLDDVKGIKNLLPVLPVHSRRDITVPFASYKGMVEYNRGKNYLLSELAIAYEGQRGNIKPSEVVAKMENIVDILVKSIAEGLAGTEYDDRILGCQSAGFAEAMKSGKLLGSTVLNTMTLYVSSLMEVKSSMGIIVAAPTAGACAGLPGAVLGAVDALELTRDHAVRGMLAAGLIGVFIAMDSTFAAEVCGCQAECGSASGMAAAALAEMGDATAEQSVSAASMALQNILGMICDPVANRVEVPCLTKNALAASNGLTCANMALAGFDAVIPLDEVIQTMDQVGRSIAPELRCTALGGLSITKTAKTIETQLTQPH